MRTVEPLPASDILLVDDDTAVTRPLAALLRRNGYTVAVVHSGRAAMAHLARGPVRLVISDIFMPEGDGIEFLHRLRQLTSRPPVLAMSGTTEERLIGMMEVARKLGAAQVFMKPFEPHRLLENVAELIGRPGCPKAA